MLNTATACCRGMFINIIDGLSCLHISLDFFKTDPVCISKLSCSCPRLCTVLTALSHYQINVIFQDLQKAFDTVSLMSFY